MPCRQASDGALLDGIGPPAGPETGLAGRVHADLELAARRLGHPARHDLGGAVGGVQALGETRGQPPAELLLAVDDGWRSRRQRSAGCDGGGFQNPRFSMSPPMSRSWNGAPSIGAASWGATDFFSVRCAFLYQ
jgi:hypothetical protein